MPKKPSGRLAAIAADMRAGLSTNGWRQHTLTGGLIVILQRNGERYRLALGRESVPPSDTEIAVCVAAFNVPDGTEPQLCSKKAQNAKTGRWVDWHVAELRWIELEPTTSPMRPKSPTGPIRTLTAARAA